MKPIILEKDKDGRIKVTSEDIQKMIDEAYQSGYEDGRKSIQVIIPPYSPEPWWKTPWYCTDHVTITSGSKMPDVTL